MAMTEKIRIAIIKRKISLTELAKRINSSQANLSNKLKRDNFSEKELQEIAEALNCDLDQTLIMRDTGERI